MALESAPTAVVPRWIAERSDPSDELSPQELLTKGQGLLTEVLGILSNPICENAQVPARRVVYLENTAMFVGIAEGIGIRSILHTAYCSTWAQLASLGLRNDDEASHVNR